MRQPLRFALAGKIVSTSKQADSILRRALDRGQGWLIPQARSVRRQLEAQERS